MTLLLHILEQSLIFLPFALGVYLSYQVLQKADLTVDGSFVLGAAVYGQSVLLGVPLLVSIALAVLAGMIAGLGTGLLQYRDRMSGLIAGILALFILQSVNLAVMGRPNLNLLGQASLLGLLDGPLGTLYGSLTLLTILSMMLLVGMSLFLRSNIGVRFHAFGENSKLLRLLGFRAEIYRITGLALSNGLVALSGVLTAQYQGYVDVGMGAGLVLVGIGSVLIGERYLLYLAAHRIPTMPLRLLCCTLGAATYFGVLNGLIAVGVNPIYLKLTIGLALAAMLYLRHSSNSSIEVMA